MFNFIVIDNQTEKGNETTARIIDGDVITLFCFMNTKDGLDTLGGVNVNGLAVRSNFTQHYDGGLRRFDTDHQS